MFLARHDGSVSRDEKLAVSGYVHHRVEGVPVKDAHRYVRLALGIFPTANELAEALVRLRSADLPQRNMVVEAGAKITAVNPKLFNLIVRTLAH
jgi:hypothetical protein